MTMTLQEWLTYAAHQLSTRNIGSARLDAELLLSHATGFTREYLLAHSEDTLLQTVQSVANTLLERRLKREPLAYIFGKKEFYGRSFIVTPDTLIPRPETETMIEIFKTLHLDGAVLDVGTGSGCIGITLKLEQPDIDITLSDISPEALSVARENARTLGVDDIVLQKSDMLARWDRQANALFDVIVSNPPYVDRSWRVSPETTYEPQQALFAEDDGLLLIHRLIDQALLHLTQHGHLLIEADPRQHSAIVDYAKSFEEVMRDGFIIALQKRS
jgi:release factor glutamine methyltransferase